MCSQPQPQTEDIEAPLTRSFRAIAQAGDPEAQDRQKSRQFRPFSGDLLLAESTPKC
jgi:hypothetical protein